MDGMAPPPLPSPPPRKGFPTGLVFLFGCLGCLGVLVLVGLGVAGFAYLAQGRYSEATAADRAVVLTAAEVAPYFEGFEPVPGVGKVQRCAYFDGSMAVEYEYEDPRQDVPFYLTCTAGVEKNAEEAKSTYEMLGAGEKIGFALGGGSSVSEVVRNELFGWGDESRFCLLKVDGNPVGHSFRARRGEKTFHLMFVGVYFDEPEPLEEMILPVLERFETYQP